MRRAPARASCSSGGSAPPKPTSREVDRPSAARPARPSWRATGARWSCSTPPAATRWRRSSAPRERGPGRARRLRGDPRRAAAAGDARRACGCSSTPASARTAAASAGTAASGCPSAPTRPGSSGALAEHGVEWFCVDQSAHEPPLGGADARSPTEAGPVALPIDWEAISWLWSLDGYPSDPAYAQFDGKSLRGMRLWRIGGGAYDPAAAERRARARQARRVPRRGRRAPARATPPSAAAAACSSSRSTPSCSATGGRRGRPGCEAVLEGAAAAGRAAA